MSAKNGDIARHHIRRKKTIQRRVKSRALQAAGAEARPPRRIKPPLPVKGEGR